MTRCLVYGLRLPGGLIRYIGQTTRTIEARMARHRSQVRNGGQSAVTRWMRKHPDVEAVVIMDEAVWNVDEMAIIAIARLEGLPLLNLTDGGGGTLGHRFKMSDEHRRKISEAKKRYKFTPAHCDAIFASRKCNQ